MNSENVVVITGASKGIGFHLAKHYLDRGSIVFGCSRSSSELKGIKYTHCNVDVSDEESVMEFVRNIAKEHGKISVLINNAGVMSTNLVMLSSMKKTHEMVAANLLGTYLMCREVAKVMIRKKNGRIVNFSSNVVSMLVEGDAIYASVKSGVEVFTKVLARELGSFGITCNVVAPSPIRTEMLEGVPEKEIQKIIDRLAIKRWCAFKDVSNVIDFLVKPESGFVTGQVIGLGGA